ncbi:MAG: cell division protein ZapE [Rhodospirillales bacterium]|nr:cell division protein ZapE [Rhodospirillales bacterium]MCB9995046.1 cell division protein ZapE [Rhodospirillales bacterium]
MPSPLEAYRDLLKQGDLRPDPGQQAAMDELQRLYDALLSSKAQGNFLTRLVTKKTPLKGVYLWGGVGRGKSMLMDLFFRCLPDRVPKRRIHFHEFMIETHDFLHKARQDHDSEAAILKRADALAAQVRVLCFDEFHVTDIADAMILGRLFTALFKQGVVIVATSNWAPDRLYEGGLQRDLFLPFIALLKDKTTVMELHGPIDYRLQCLSESGVYFSPLGPASKKQADDAFAHLTEGVAPYDETLTVKGRSLHVETVAKGTARFSFAQLCERPMGAEDYLAIAKNYHTVFLDGVPKLKYDRRNEAKRLMILIDALYDTHTKLVMTADAAPDELYQGHDHAFEFERTVSRLIEMQSADYLAG